MYGCKIRASCRNVNGEGTDVAKVTTPPESWIEEGFRALAKGGPEAVRIDSLAKELGVTRGGFYWHFSDRRALLDKMLDAWEQESVDDILAQLDDASPAGRDHLLTLFSLANARPERLPIELAIRDWARRDEAVWARLKRVDNRRMEYMRAQFGAFVKDPVEVETRCLLAFAVFVANDQIAATHSVATRGDLLAYGFGRLLEDG